MTLRGAVAVEGGLPLVLDGKIIGAVGVNFGRSILTNYFPELWPFFLGGLFIAVVLLFPDGLVGLMRRMNTDVIRHLFVKGKPAPEGTQP